jgi:hypothetical protein
MRVRLHPVPVVCAGQVIFSFGQARDVLAGFGELIAEVPDELTVQAGFPSGPDGAPVLFFLPTWSGAADDGAPCATARRSPPHHDQAPIRRMHEPGGPARHAGRRAEIG